MLTPDDLRRALDSLRADKPAAPSLTKEDLTEALVAALGQFTDERGNLRVRQNNGGSPYGGGG